MEGLSICIICKNEGKNIRRCIESAIWADEVLIYDTGSTDNTVEICKEYKITIYENNPWEGSGKSFHNAINKAKNDWVFHLDADEEITKDLKASIQNFMNNPTPDIAFRIKRVSFFMGQKINYSSWQRDHTLRLFNRKNGNFNFKPLHPFVEVNCPIKMLEGILLHYTYPNLRTQISKMLSHSERGADYGYEKKQKSSVSKACIRGIAKFIKMYIINFGFLDGKKGFVLAINASFGVYLKYIYLWEKLQNPKND